MEAVKKYEAKARPVVLWLLAAWMTWCTLANLLSGGPAVAASACCAKFATVLQAQAATPCDAKCHEMGF